MIKSARAVLLRSVASHHGHAHQNAIGSHAVVGMTNAAVSFMGAGDAPSTQPGHDPVFGDPSLLAASRANRVKGNLVSARSWYVREHYGDEMHARIASALPSAARALLEVPPLPMAWCPMGEMMDIDRAIHLTRRSQRHRVRAGSRWV